MRTYAVLLALAVTLTLSPSASAQDSEATPAELADHKPSGITLAKLVAVRNLRCDALSRGKQARLKADIYRAEVSSAQLGRKIIVRQEATAAEEEAGAAYEEAGNLKRRVKSMLERFTADHQLLWYQTVDEAERVRIEEMINGAREVVDEACVAKSRR
jgi:hypothetical protein